MESSKFRRIRASHFRFEMQCSQNEKQSLLSKLKAVKETLTNNLVNNVTNYTVMDYLLNHYISCNSSNSRKESNDNIECNTNNFIEKEHTLKEPMFVTSRQSLEKCIEIAQRHGQYCRAELSITNDINKGHVLTTVLKCNQHHSYRWSSSPYIMNTGKYMVNQRILHGYSSSGLLPSEYSRFVNGAGIGYINSVTRRAFTQSYRSIVQRCFDIGIERARLEEIGMNEDNFNNDDKEPVIDILTDARHGWRKNTKDSTVVAIGDITHKVVACENVTRNQEPVSQKHEIYGSNKIKESLEADGINIGVWAHDSNSTVNTYVESMGAPTVNQNETWHGGKNVKKEMSKVCKGPRYKEGKTWHHELSDKVSTKTYHTKLKIVVCSNIS